MPYFYYGFDWTYLWIALPCLLLAGLASSAVNRTFRRYASSYSQKGITGAQAAEAVLRHNGVYAVPIEHVSGNLTDHYDPRANCIRLSDEVYASTSISAIGVACHEAGHAVQYAKGYGPVKVRAAVIPITNFGSRAAMPLILLGVLLGFLGYFSNILIYSGILCFSFSLLFQLLTLPVEINASRRAMTAIKEAQLLNDTERIGAQKTLTAAAMTYVAAVAVSFAQLLRLILLYGRRRDQH